MGEGTRIGEEGGLPEGAAATAPTAPHATPPSLPADSKTGPARFWGKKRWPVAVAIGVSLVAHWLLGPFSILPSGPDIEIKDQDGELTVDIDAIQSGLEEPKTAEPTPTATGGGIATPPTPGAGDAGVDAALHDADVEDARALSTIGDGGPPGDGSSQDAMADGGEDSGVDLGDAGIAAAGGSDAGLDGASGNDPNSMLGGVTSVAAGPANVTVLVNMAVVKTHPAASRLAPILAAIPQWKQFMAGSAIDPLRDCDWILIRGPSLIDTQKDAVYVHYSAPDAVVDGTIATIAKAYPTGGPIDVGVPKVKAWKAYADRGERVFLRPSPGVAVIVPSTHATLFARALVNNPLVAKLPGNEAVRVVALRPGGSISVIPSSISEMRLWVVPRNADGGADVYAEGDCPDPASAAQAAADFKDVIQKKNSFGVRLVTAGLFNSVDVTSSGSMVKAHLSASREQIDAVLGLVAGQVGATLPPPGSTGTATAPLPSAPPPPPPPPGSAP